MKAILRLFRILFKGVEMKDPELDRVCSLARRDLHEATMAVHRAIGKVLPENGK